MSAQQRSSSTFLVEHYWPGVTVASFEAAAKRVAAAVTALRREGAMIHMRHSTVVPVDEAAFCAFDASSAALVEEAYARAGVQFERLVETIELPGTQANP